MIRQRRGTRRVLLTLAAAVLLLGAVTAGVAGYQTIGRGFGPASGTVTGPAPGR